MSEPARGATIVEVAPAEAAARDLPPIAIRVDVTGAGVAVHRFWRPGNYLTLSRTDDRPAGRVTSALSLERAEGGSADLAAIERALRARAVDAGGQPVPLTLGPPGQLVVAGTTYLGLAAAFGEASDGVWSLCAATLIPTAYGPLLLMLSVDPMPATGVLPCSAIAASPAFDRLLRGLTIAGNADLPQPMWMEVSPDEARARGLLAVGVRVDATGAGMLGDQFSFRSNYLYLRSGNGDATFSVSGAGEAAQDLAAIERAVRAELNYAACHPVIATGAGALVIGGARRPALAFTTGTVAAAGRYAWCGTLIGVAGGSLLVVMGVEQPHGALTCDELAGRPAFQQLLRSFTVVDHSGVRPAPRAQLGEVVGAFLRAATPLDAAVYQLSHGLAAVGVPVAQVIAGQRPMDQLPGALASARQQLAAARSALLATAGDAELVRLADGRLWLVGAIEERVREAALDGRGLFRLNDDFLDNQRAWQLEMAAMVSAMREVSEIAEALQRAPVDGAIVARLRRLVASFASSDAGHRWSAQPEREGFARLLARHGKLATDVLALVDAGATARPPEATAS